MKMLKVVVSVATIAIFSINLAMAANYTVGAPNGGWDQATNLTTWASSQTFLVGDNLIFQYTQNHDVTEVSKADFDSCTASNPLQPPRTGGLTVVPLTSSGSRYLICGTGGHCLGGMKVEIDILASSAPPPSTTPSVPSPPPTPSARRPVSSPPSNTTPASNPTLPPASAPPPGNSLPPPPPPAPSSAAKFSVMGFLTACSGFLMMMSLNL